MTYTDITSDGGMDPRNDPDSDAARLERHRKLHNIDLPPHPDVVAAKNLQKEASYLVAQAISEVDRIVDTNLTGYSDFPTNPRRNMHDRRAFTLKDARPHAQYAARLLREAWEMLDPSMSRPPQIHADHALRTRLIDLGWTPPNPHTIERIPTVAWQHPARADLVTSDPTAYTGLSAGKPRELVRKDAVLDRIEWLEHGVDEWRATALAALKKLKDLENQ